VDPRGGGTRPLPGGGAGAQAGPELDSEVHFSIVNK